MVSASITAHRRGAGLVEALVALVLLAIGALGVAAGSQLAIRRIQLAAQQEEAALQGAELLDSLLQLSAPVDGTRTAGIYRLSWRVRETGPERRVQLSVEYGGGRTTRTVLLEGIHAPTPLPYPAEWP